jgi:pantoate--beta-alanine ligase
MRPEWVTQIADVRARLRDARAKGWRVGLVPTMGALHGGHASLMASARSETDYRVVSIFVNPAQFGAQEDFSQYPRTPGEDLALCEAQQVQLVFAPEPNAIYPQGYRTSVQVEGLQDMWEGASRAGHFRGVATVVAKLLNIIQPDVAYFGQKDAQQAVLVGRMVRDLDMDVQVRLCPTVREPDGLALSSRNRYLTAEQRGQATVLFEALELGRHMIQNGERDPSVVEKSMTDLITSKPAARLDYVAIVDWEDLSPLKRITGNVLLAVAVRFGTARLIDNVLLEAIDLER